jgi:N-acetylmuramoyl-L-alanine amidase
MVPVRFVSEAFKTGVHWNGANNTIYLGKYDGTEKLTSKGETFKEKKELLVVIDPGHGGKDPGARSGGISEKNLNLDIAKRLDALLKKEGIKTRMTRTKDTYVGLYERSEFANRLDADLFVSIHNNAGRSRYSGTMTLYHPGSRQTGIEISSRELASIAQKEMVRRLGSRNIGIIQRPNLAVLRTTKMPAILAEIGYMSNSSELKKLKSPDYRQKSAEALKDAIVKVLDKQ